jgi:hypothetical protein
MTELGFWVSEPKFCRKISILNTLDMKTRENFTGFFLNIVRPTNGYYKMYNINIFII